MAYHIFCARAPKVWAIPSVNPLADINEGRDYLFPDYNFGRFRATKFTVFCCALCKRGHLFSYAIRVRNPCSIVDKRKPGEGKETPEEMRFWVFQHHRPLADIQENWERSFAALDRGSKDATRDDGSGFASERQVCKSPTVVRARMPTGTQAARRNNGPKADINTPSECHCDILDSCRFHRKSSMVENDLASPKRHTGCGFQSIEPRRVIQRAPNLRRNTVSP